MVYSVKEIFYTLQGEGAYTGRPAVFLRFSGCNLWSGQDHDRSNAICDFCDTDFRRTDGPNGGHFESSKELTEAIKKNWPYNASKRVKPLVVCTGGEPLLQLDEALIDDLHNLNFEVAIETNGTLVLPRGVDWVCVSPKACTKILIQSGDELKLVFPQPDAPPELYETMCFTHFFLQPMDGVNLEHNTKRAVQYCLDHPQWRLSLQTHKYLGIA